MKNAHKNAILGAVSNHILASGNNSPRYSIPIVLYVESIVAQKKY
jgi:hypothetical protein